MKRLFSRMTGADAPHKMSYEEARSALEKARALDPQDPRVTANLEELDALEKGVKMP